MRSFILALALACLPFGANAATIGNGSGSPHAEFGSISSTMGTCLASALCSLGTYTFVTPFSSTPTRVAGNSNTVAANAAAMPVVYSVSTTSVTVYVYAIGVISSLAISAYVMCVGNS